MVCFGLASCSRAPAEQRSMCTRASFSVAIISSYLIPLIPFFVKIERIGETGETVPEVANVLATRVNTG
jgi:hypothetical protein